MASSAKEEEHDEPLLENDSDNEALEFSEFDGDYVKLTRPRSDSQASVIPTKPAGNKLTTYLAIAGTLLVTVLGFTINTEATAYFEDVLGWKKPFCTMYITHGSLCWPWFVHLIYLRIKNRKTPWKVWFSEYLESLRESVTTIDAYNTLGPKLAVKRRGRPCGPLIYLAVTMLIVTAVLTVSGTSWFSALSFTTPADLTAIYNCSTFFAAAFSVPILKERLGWFSITAVAFSIIGTFIIAYGDSTSEHGDSEIGSSRLVGNLVACVGAVAFGLYEVLFKKWACSSRALPPQESLPLTLAASALTGIFTFATLWIALVVLHFTGVETFVWPSAHVALWIVIAVLTGSMSISLLVVLVIWTDPVFGSMANVLAVFVVALSDWLVFGLEPSIATYIGGALILVAFGMLTKDTLGEGRH